MEWLEVLLGVRVAVARLLCRRCFVFSRFRQWLASAEAAFYHELAHIDEDGNAPTMKVVVQR